MTILTSEGFGLRATKLLDSQLASVNLESQETKIRTQSGEFVLEARPDADPNKSWHGFLHGAKKLEKYPQELSCRVALVSDCQSEL